MKKEFAILKSSKKLILAYSGGLDTSILPSWLKENGAGEVIAVSCDLGQVKDPKALEKKALGSKADKFYNIDLAEDFIKDFAYPTVKAGAKYENKYLLGTAIARPLMAKALVDIYKKEGADLIVHGCTGKGNDQIRFELSIMALDPDIKILAPWRFWDIKGRSDELAYAKKHGIKIDSKTDETYSEDKNLWHISHEGLDLEDPKNPADLKKVLKWVTPPELCKDEPEIVKISFIKGEPVSVNGEKLDPVSLIKTLNKIGGRNGIGIDDMVESRLVGMKSRGLYENPAASILYFAHQNLEEITVSPDTLKYKQKMAHDYADLIYNGKMMTQLKKAMDAFIDISQENVTGEVSLKLYKGSMIGYGMEAKNSLFDLDYASFEEDDVYDQSDATGFIKLFGLSTKIYAGISKEN